MERLMRTPSRYVQEKNVLYKMKDHTEMLGKSFYVIGSKSGTKATKEKIEKSFEGSDINLVFEEFTGECTWNEVARIRKLIKENKSDVVVGIGGGKSIDTAKVVAFKEGLPVVVIPTVAATDAPCTALSVVYTEEGAFSDYVFFPTNPNVVMVDTDVMAQAPVKFLVSGIGDALATFYEARACRNSNSLTLAFGGQTEAGFALSTLCHEILMEYSEEAKVAVENKVVTPALEKVIEATTYLSGVGAENGGLGAAHSIYNGFTSVSKCDHMSHGELVAFGTIVQLVLEGSKKDELYKIIIFCRNMGLPTSLKDIGLDVEKDKEEIMKAAKLACSEGESIHNLVDTITPEKLYDGIIAASGISSNYL